MNYDFSKNYLYLPIKVLILFNLFTVVLFIFGPVYWLNIDELKVVLYLILNLSALFLGYSFGVKRYSIKQSFNYHEREKLVTIVIFVSFLWLFPSLYIRLGITGVNFSEIINKVVEGFLEPVVGYREKVAAVEDRLGERSNLKVFNFLFMSPFMYAFFPFSILYFKKFSRPVRIAIIVFFFLECLSWVSIGTNKGVVDLFLFAVFTGIIVNPNMLKFSVKRATFFVIAIVLILYFFISTMLSRFGVIDNSELLYNLDFNVLSNPLKNTGIYADMNLAVKFGMMQITSYLSQGYYNLALALEEPIIWTYGFGNSWMSLDIWRLFTGQDMLPDTYLGIIQKKHFIDANVAWHSIYTWIANDFTFLGVPFVIFFIGYNLALSWLDSVYKRSIYASVVFCLFSQMIFYFYANNQILSFTIIPFFVFYSLWQVDRNRIKFNFHK